jgi:hypothetical protein
MGNRNSDLGEESLEEAVLDDEDYGSYEVDSESGYLRKKN